MRIPSDPDNPTYDHTYHVGFWKWLTSSAAERKEWTRRRNAAIHTSRSVRYLQSKEDAARAKADQQAEQRRQRRAQ